MIIKFRLVSKYTGTVNLSMINVTMLGEHAFRYDISDTALCFKNKRGFRAIVASYIKFFLHVSFSKMISGNLVVISVFFTGFILD